MAAPGKRKLVQQEELRRLMKAKQQKTAARKRIESPLAKYNYLGHLSCIVCNVQIKSELLWQAHILGKQHKEKVADLKDKNVSTSNLGTAAHISTKAANVKSSITKNSAELASATSTTSTVPAGFFEETDKTCHKQSTKISSGLALMAGIYDDDDDDNNNNNEEEEAGETVSSHVSTSEQKSRLMPLPASTAGDNSLPADFFDHKTSVVSHSGSILKANVQEKQVEKKDSMAEALPEGFFDDPEVDAKVRKVDAPKDQLDKEWEEFQKEMRQVNTVSEAIVAEEDEEGRLDRRIDEIDEQIECYRRIEHLRNRKDILHETLISVMPCRSSKEQEDAVGSDDEEILPIMLTQNWREKGTFL